MTTLVYRNPKVGAAVLYASTTPTGATGAQLTAAAIATATVTANLSGTSAQLTASASAIASASGMLSTSIALAAAVIAQAYASATFAGQGAALSASAAARASATGSLTTSISLAAAAQAVASGQAALSTQIALTAIAQAQASAAGTLVGGVLVISADQFSRDRKRVRLLVRSLNFSPKRAAEREIFAVDFAPLLAPGETISSPAWSITAVVGNDDTASSMLVGQAAYSGTIAAHIIAGGVPGVEYAPVCTVQTSFGQTLALPDVDEGHLYISQ